LLVSVYLSKISYTIFFLICFLWWLCNFTPPSHFDISTPYFVFFEPGLLLLHKMLGELLFQSGPSVVWLCWEKYGIVWSQAFKKLWRREHSYLFDLSSNPSRAYLLEKYVPPTPFQSEMSGELPRALTLVSNFFASLFE